MPKKEIFDSLKRLLKKHSRGLELKNKIVDSQAKDNKPQLHLYGKNKVSIMGLPKRQTYIAGVMIHKNFVGFYSMPLYAFPKIISLKNKLLKKSRKGKSCLNLTDLDKPALKELDAHLKKGIAAFKKKGWV